MNVRANDINIKVIYDDEVYELKTYIGEYRNLMMLIFDKIYIEDFGECKGMGRCGTCVIEIIESKNELPMLKRNEEATIVKTGIINSKIRLACQILINEDINNATVRIWRDN